MGEFLDWRAKEDYFLFLFVFCSTDLCPFCLSWTPVRMYCMLSMCNFVLPATGVPVFRTVRAHFVFPLRSITGRYFVKPMKLLFKANSLLVKYVMNVQYGLWCSVFRLFFLVRIWCSVFHDCPTLYDCKANVLISICTTFECWKTCQIYGKFCKN